MPESRIVGECLIKSRRKVCMAFRRTGYPLPLAMNAVDGSNKWSVGSACHRPRTLADGRGSERSSAGEELVI